MRLLAFLLFLVLFLAGGCAAAVYFWLRPPLDDHPLAADPATLEAGRYLAALGGCAGCHTAPGGAPFAGGRRVEGPLGTRVSANITPDPASGIGGMSSAAFYGALAYGAPDYLHPLYPAMPYPFLRLLTRTDSDALFAYLKSQPPVATQPPERRPLSPRLLLYAWNAFAASRGAFRPQPERSAAWNRGAYLVLGVMQCGRCHTPTNPLGGRIGAQALEGAQAGRQWSPAIAPPSLAERGWTPEALERYLESGRKPDGGSTPPDVWAQKAGLAALTAADRAAVAQFLFGGALPD